MASLIASMTAIVDVGVKPMGHPSSLMLPKSSLSLHIEKQRFSRAGGFQISNRWFGSPTENHSGPRFWVGRFENDGIEYRRQCPRGHVDYVTDSQSARSKWTRAAPVSVGKRTDRRLQKKSGFENGESPNTGPFHVVTLKQAFGQKRCLFSAPLSSILTEPRFETRVIHFDSTH